jgi:hypothetical protein
MKTEAQSTTPTPPWARVNPPTGKPSPNMAADADADLRRRLKEVQQQNPDWTFQRCWNHLQRSEPYRFEGNQAGISLDAAPALLAHNRGVRNAAQTLMDAAGFNPDVKKIQAARLLLVRGSESAEWVDPNGPLGPA